MTQSLGGIATTSRLTLYPMQIVNTNQIGFYAFDPSAGFDDPNAGGFYSFKVEEVLPGRAPTIGGAIILYRDLGQATVTFTMTGTTELGQVLSQNTQSTWGNAQPTGRLFTMVQALGFPACQNPQLTIVRAAGSGPVSIVKLVLYGRVEVAQVFN